MKPLRIAVLAPTFLPKCSGAEVFHHNLASRLVDAGHSVTVIAPRGRVRRLRAQGWELAYDLEAYPDKLWNLLKRTRSLAFWLNRRALSALQRKHGFDVWHAFVLYPAGVVLADWQSRSGMPGLVRAVGDDVSGLPAQRHPVHVARCLREKLPSAGALVALSREMADELSTLGVAREKIYVIPNAVDADRFAPDKVVRSAVRKEMGIAEEEFVFLCVARNHPQKDLPTLVEAFRRLCSRDPDIKVRLIIAGRDTEALRAQAGDLAERLHCLEIGADSSLRGIPTMPPQRLIDLYRASDAFVLSSLLEGFSSALVEAMAAGLPILVTDVQGIRGVLAPGTEGIFVPAGSPDEMASAMRGLINDPALRSRLASAARNASRRYTWPAVVSSYEALYRQLVGRGMTS